MLQALAIGIQKGSQWFAKKLEAGKEFTSSDNVHKIADSMIKRNKLNVTVDYIYIKETNKVIFKDFNLN